MPPARSAQVLAAGPGGLDASNVAATTVTPGAPGWSYVDRSVAVPAVAQAFESGTGAARDLDQDGDPDLVLVTGPAFSPHVFRNDGNFTFADVTASAIPGNGAIEAAIVEAFDANGDGREDLLVIGGAGDPQAPPLPNVLLLNQGNLTFQSAPFPAVAGIAREVAVADLDIDGDLDLVFANGTDGQHATESPLPNVLLVNQGFAQGGVEGAFVIDSAFQNSPWNSASFNTSVCLGDIDNDGDFDLFFGRSDTQSADGIPGQSNLLIRNDGALNFTDLSPNLIPNFSDNTAGARFGDVDGDGWLDLLVANSTVSVKSANSGDYYRNLGGGAFVEDNASFPQIDESEIALRVAIRLVDVDLDGDLDVLHGVHEFFDFNGSSGAQTGGDDHLFVNQGGAQGGQHGTFVRDTNFTKTGIFVTADQIHADFDLDGDDDLYISCLGGLFGPPVNDRLLENTRIP
jgi:FG-GAP-like repeat